MSAADNLYAELTRGVAHAQVRQHLIDEHRAEVLIEAADAVDSGKAPFPEDVKSGASWAARMLRRMADGEGKGTGTTGGEPTPTADFFQPGRTYTDNNGYRAPELTTHFHVEHVTRHPESGQLRAIGWSKSLAPGSRWHGDFRDEDEFDGWTELEGPLLPSQPTPLSRFSSTPLQIDVFLRQHLAEDVYLRYQRVIGNKAAAAAARGVRMGAAMRQASGEPDMADLIRQFADAIDPDKGAGPYPAVLLCSQHNGFGPCPGAPKCTPGGGR